MKKAFDLVLMYIVFFILGTVLGTLFYSLFINVINFVAGQKLDIFDSEIIIKALFYVAIAMCFLIFPLLSYYRIRHAGGFPQALSYMLLTVFTLAVMIPGVLQIKKVYYEKNPPSTHISHLSGGYFRPVGDKVYFFTRDLYPNPLSGIKTPTVVIDTSDEGKVTIEKKQGTDDLELYKEAAPCKEILVKKAFSDNISFRKTGITVLVENLQTSYEKGLTFFLGVLSVCFAISAVYAVTSFFEWKLLDAFFVILNSALILLGYGYYYTSPSEKLQGFLSNTQFIQFLGKYIDDPVLVLTNVILGVLFIIIGVITYAVKKHKAKKS